MMIHSLNSSLMGLQRNQQNFLNSADNISKWGTSGVGSDGQGIDLSEEIAGVISAQRGYEANLAVIKTEDEMLGSLLDVMV